VLKRVTEIEDRVRVLDSFLDNENIVTISSLNVDTFYGRNDEAESCNTRSVDTVPNNPDMCFAEKNSRTPTEEPFIVQVERRPQPFNEAMTPTNELITSPPQTGSSGKPIPVRISRRFDEAMIDDGYRAQRRRHIKHFCVLGYRKSVNVNTLYKYITEKGPTVSSLRIFPVRKSPNKVVIRLNLEDNCDANNVLEQNFWPRFVKCVPWKSRTELKRSRRCTENDPVCKTRHFDEEDAQRINVEEDRCFWHEYSNGDTFSMNRYEPLSTDID
jgi:hypothetical protein